MIAPRQRRTFARHFALERGIGRFWLVEGTLSMRGAYLPFIDWNTAHYLLRDVANKVTWADEPGLRQFYANMRGRRGVPQSMPLSELVDLIVEALRVDRLHLYDLGSSDIALVRDIEGIPEHGMAGTPQQVAKVSRIVESLVAVPMLDIDKRGQAIFAEFKDELTKSSLMAGVMKTVLSAWLAAAGLEGGSFRVDSRLLGLLIYLIGTDAFGWLEDLAALIVAIDKAETAEAFHRCTATLANLMIEIGVGGFITLLLGAVGVKITRT